MPKVSLIDGDVSTEKKTSSAKLFKDTDLIPCISVTNGKLVAVGARSNNKYTWSGMGEVEQIEYRDLVAMVTAHSPLVFKPRFIIQDDKFLAKYDNISNFYGELYTPEDIRAVLSLPATQLEATIRKMPVGAQDALKGLAIRMIEQGELDSIQRIKVIDSIFGTQMLLKMAN